MPEKIYAGLMISYRMKAVFGIPLDWLSEVSHCDEPRRFVYEQRIGPFKFWSHVVCLTEQHKGIVFEDIMFYAMPLGWLGRLINSVLIAENLERIFDIRRDYLSCDYCPGASEAVGRKCELGARSDACQSRERLQRLHA